MSLRPVLSVLYLCLAFLATGFGAHAATTTATPADATAAPASTPVAAIATWSDIWHDAKRDRDVPVKIYYPKDLSASSLSPVILFSHGLGGSRDGYAYLGEYWAAHGYVSVHLQHAGSDVDVWRDSRRPMKALRDAASDPAAIVNRPLDLSFALDRLEALDADTAFPLHGKLDLKRVGAAGHSFGAFTVMALTGWQPAAAKRSQELADPRIKAVIAMSTPAARRDSPETSAYASVRLPVFHLTGTEDTDRAGGASDPEQRRIPYDRTTNAPAWLLTLEGGDHMVFSGAGGGEGTGKRAGALLGRKHDRSRDPEFHGLILTATTKFWDAQLKADDAALAWMNGDGFVQAAGALGKVERKAP